MSHRGDEGFGGSSRSSYKHGERDKYSDSRKRRNRSRSRERSRYRSRSRSRDRARTDENRWNSSNNKTDTIVREMSISPQRERRNDRSSSGSPSPPPPPFISKVSMEFKGSGSKPLKMTLNPPVTQNKPAVVKKPVTVASVFNDASDEEPEEMPPEARMRMRNIGRDTPTSSGPNSYGKTKHGFCDQKAITQKSLKAAMEKANPGPNVPKFANTIYKLGQ